jgi:hypothetical protein
MIPEAVLWIDPGDDTGLAWLLDHGTAFYAWEFKFFEAGDQIEATCQQHGPRLAVGWERYDIRTRLPQTHAYDAIGIIAVTRRAVRRYGCQVLDPAQQHTPTPAEHRELEAIGWWVKGRNDAQSAAGHLLAWLRRSHNLPPREREILSAVRTTL